MIIILSNFTIKTYIQKKTVYKVSLKGTLYSLFIILNLLIIIIAIKDILFL